VALVNGDLAEERVKPGDDDYPNPSSAAASAVMRANRRRDTKPERLIRSLLHRRGLRYRVDYSIETGDGRVRVDIAFPGERVAVLVDGCFWHSCPLHGNAPRANEMYWSEKLARNRARDLRDTRRLTDAGWHVLRFWEHEAPPGCADAIEVAVGKRRKP
jgi:DNA mismatch endonuclease (patch repair protein)